MIKAFTSLLVSSIILFVSAGYAFPSTQTYDLQENAVVFKRKHKNNPDYRRKHNYPRTPEERQDDETPLPEYEEGSDLAIVEAVERRRRVDFVEGGGMVVIKLLPDDNKGLRHQKWVVRLSNGQSMEAVYNSDMCERVPLKVGDVIAMGGQFIYTNQGPLLHWLHYDPRGKRPDGYVQLNGKFYCKEGQRR